MALERRNPVPIGRYWVDVFDQVSTHPATKGQNTQTAFRDWLRRNASTVKSESTQSFDSKPARDFYIFRVTAPTPWEGPGFPEVAPAAVQSSADTAQRPDPEKDPLDQLGDALGSASSTWSGLVLAVGVGAAALVLVNVWAASRGR
jgi:hypothetical protein